MYSQCLCWLGASASVLLMLWQWQQRVLQRRSLPHLCHCQQRLLQQCLRDKTQQAQQLNSATIMAGNATCMRALLTNAAAGAALRAQSWQRNKLGSCAAARNGEQTWPRKMLSASGDALCIAKAFSTKQWSSNQLHTPNACRPRIGEGHLSSPAGFCFLGLPRGLPPVMRAMPLPPKPGRLRVLAAEGRNCTWPSSTGMPPLAAAAAAAAAAAGEAMQRPQQWLAGGC